MKYVIIIISVLALALLIINFIELNQYVVRTAAIKNSKIKDAKKICFISDLHNFKVSEKFYEDIKKQSPDVILLGGDIITAKPGREQKNAYEFIEKVSGIAPVFMALGNHEYRAKIYPDVYADMYPELEKFLENNKVSILSNSSIYFEDANIKVSACEIDRFFYKRFVVQNMADDYIESLIGRIDDKAYNILLAHNPDYFKKYSAYGSDLILSGHVHGGLIRLPFIGGVAHPGVRFFPKYSGGPYNEKGKQLRYKKNYADDSKGIIRLIVSAGVGFHTLPLRLFNPGELIFVTFTNK